MFTPIQGRRADIDGLRAIAVLGVLAVHTGLSPLLLGGAAGVDIFFVISGYLITGILLKDLQANNFSVVEFYARRARRLFPALITVLVCTLLVGWMVLLPAEFRELGRQALGGTAFALNLVLYYDGGYQTFWMLQHLWSLGVEEQFYLVWPIYTFAVTKIYGGRMFIPATLLLTVISLMASVIFSTSDPQAGFFLPTSRLWELGIGGLIASIECQQARCSWGGLLDRGQNISSRARSWMSMSGALLIIGSAIFVDATMRFPGWIALVPTLGTAFLILSGPGSWLNERLLSHPVMVWIGLVSYPLYLWHFPLLSGLHLLAGPQPGAMLVLATIAVAFVLSWATFKYIELPIRRMRGRLIPSLLCVAMSLVGLTGYLVFAQIVATRSVAPGVQQLQTAMAEDWLSGTSNVYWTPYTNAPITVGNGARKVLFVGDHHMQQYFPRVRALVSESDPSLSAIFVTRSWCPPVDGLRSLVQFDAACSDFLKEVIHEAADPAIDLVVVSYCWECYFVSREPTTEVLLQKLALVSVLLSELSREGRRAYLILAGPSGSEFDPRWMIERRMFGNHGRVARPMPARSDVERKVGSLNRQLIEIANKTGFHVIDPISSLCDKDVCPSVLSNGEPIFHDSLNLRPSFVAQSAHFLDELLCSTGVARPVSCYAVRSE